MTTTRFISFSRREARSRSPTRARRRCPGSPASARSETSTSLSTINHNCLNDFTGFGELAGLVWLQGQEKKGRKEAGEKLQNGGIIECCSHGFLSIISSQCLAFWFLLSVPLLPGKTAIFTRLHLQWRTISPDVVPSHPASVLLPLSFPLTSFHLRSVFPG